MDDEKRATWIRRLAALVLIGGAIAAGFFIDFTGSTKAEEEKDEDRVEQVDPENFRNLIAEENCLTVMNLRLDGNPESEQLSKIIKQLEDEETYGDQVVFTELDLKAQPDLAKAQQVDMENYLGRMDFYASGYRLGSLKGPADREKVEQTIQRYLDGLVKRFGPGWLPTVDGMTRGGKDSTILKIEPASEPKTQAPANP